ncbi:methylenetetrahydrofolate reductase [NAD(P)H] [Candidatus Nitrotoga sp. AM1P]|uniref:methylenetetrahydrofolate reductase [NAD(P)H] n=1 Tax=Candidatus Nitrotoga sp. AM1P TaxID=2559597 RepID=UPI0010B63793|nr:methylenetetrahydrofolate reductase [NAD(P)H] [Candidatus Nitrotoga sp. AM1P]BBJ23377.1 methylenetetrahydrofolate reductase [Candidatus Nitrotoga sp. AM1P]
MTNSRSFSFEFFPPQTQEGANKLAAARKQLALLKPAFFSVTFGAGGSTRERTLETVQQIQADGYEAAPHLSCVGSTRENIRAILHTYKNMGIKRIIALRGDLPSGMATSGEFHYANELVSFIRVETGEYFHIEVAAYPEFHPQAKSPRDDLLNFKRKVMAGANSAITQYFYSADGYFRFVEECRKAGVTLPIVPGIMPIMKFSQLARFSDACGAEIPRSIRKILESYGDDTESVQAFGLDVVTQLCERLLAGGAPGLHFYTLNQSAPSLEIWKRLGL